MSCVKGDPFISLILSGLLVFTTARPFAQESAPHITTEELKARLGSPDPVVIDARGIRTSTGKERMIKGAIAEDPSAPEKWTGKYGKDKTVVVYCA